MTDGIHSTIEEWTGYRPESCPWRPFFDPFVRRVLHHRDAYDSHQLAISAPAISHRLMEGILHYDGRLKACDAIRMRKESEARR